MISLALAVMVSTGAVNPACTMDDVCHSGYTRTVRPPASYTNKLKRQQMAALGLKGDPSQYEEDHFISIEIGGSPTDPHNLWPQPWPDARRKDKVENFLHRCVCHHGMRLKKAQALIYSWEDVLKKMESGITCNEL